MNNELKEIIDEFDMEYFLDRESISYKVTRGHSGEQLNVEECPCCGNSNSKVYLNKDTGLGNCFVCNETFNKQKFVKEVLGLNWGETFRTMKEIVLEQGWKPVRKTIIDTSNEDNIILPNSVELPIENKNLKYLISRGFDNDITKYFRLRYCQNGFWIYKKDGSKHVQYFDNRIIIPVYDLDGELVTFQGRDLTGFSEKKYLFPVALPGTGRFLYNGFNAIGAKRVIIGEGVFDVMALKKAVDADNDLRDIVPIGTFGKHLSRNDHSQNDQFSRFIELKNNGLKQVFIAWDGEAAALKAALRAGDDLQSLGLSVRICFLPKDKDPNEITTENLIAVIKDSKLLDSKLKVNMLLKNPY